jgi:hypothetical protein
LVSKTYGNLVVLIELLGVEVVKFALFE